MSGRKSFQDATARPVLKSGDFLKITEMMAVNTK